MSTSKIFCFCKTFGTFEFLKARTNSEKNHTVLTKMLASVVADSFDIKEGFDDSDCLIKCRKMVKKSKLTV